MGMLEEIMRGLGRPQKELPSKYFYDTRGSELFEAITRLPEYYPSRTETKLLKSTGSLAASMRWSSTLCRCRT